MALLSNWIGRLKVNELELFLAGERARGLQRFIFMARWQSIKYKYNRSLKF